MSKSSAKTMGILRENIICIVNRIGTIDLKMNFLKIKKKWKTKNIIAGPSI